MKKLIILMCIVGLTITATTKSFAQCEGFIFHIGCSENIVETGMYPARIDAAIDYWHRIGFISFTADFPSKADERQSIGLRGGFHFAGYYFGCSPYGKLEYDYYTKVKPMSGVSVGGGLLFNVRFLEWFGIFCDINQTYPLNFDESIASQRDKSTKFSFGLSMFF